MRKVAIKKLRDSLSRELKDLPLAITSDGQVVATICSLEQWNKLVRMSNHEVATSSPIYNPSTHKPGDRVMVRKGKRMIEVKVPLIDAEGNPYDT